MRSQVLSALVLVALSVAAPLTGDDQTFMLSQVNALRDGVTPAATPALNHLTWDSNLANLADRSGALCTPTKSDRNQKFFRSEVTAFFGPTNVSIDQVVSGWQDESINFGFSLLTGEGKNYTALTWSNSTTIGCAVNYCAQPYGQYYKCLVGPRGNYPGHLPYNGNCVRNPYFDCGALGAGNFSDGCSQVTCGDTNAQSSRKRDCNLGSIGCIKKASYNINGYLSSGSMTAAYCQLVCNYNKYTFSGVTQGTTCYCGNAYTSTGFVSSGSCPKTCSDGSKDCGDSAGTYVSLYRATCPAGPVTPTRSTVVESTTSTTAAKTSTTTAGTTAATTSSATPAPSTSPALDPNGYPVSLDWRSFVNSAGQTTKVSPVKDQQQCGSCWAFAASATLESMWAVKGNPLYVLAPQHYVDCTRGSPYNEGGCNGGWPTGAWDFAKSKGGQATEANYAYKAADGTCNTNVAVAPITITRTSYNPCTVGSDDSLIKALQNGPVSIAIQAGDAFSSYSSGIYGDTDGLANPSSINHAVVVEGYGIDNNGNKFWWIRNSWNTWWGIGGRIKWTRGTSASSRSGGILGYCLQVQ